MKALASDFDGTLFFGKKEESIQICDINAIQTFQKAGNVFGICTGRPLYAIQEITKNRIQFDFYITSSGAVILDREGHVLYEQCLSQTVMQALYERYHKECDVVVQADHRVYAFQNHSAMPVKQNILASPVDMQHSHIYGVSMKANDEDSARQVCNDIQQHFGEEVAAYQNLHFVDVVRKGCSKGYAVDRLKQLLHIPFLGGIGDSYNDAPLLQHADVAFTFHHSPSQIQRISNHLVSSVAEAIQIMLAPI